MDPRNITSFGDVATHMNECIASAKPRRVTTPVLTRDTLANPRTAAERAEAARVLDTALDRAMERVNADMAHEAAVQAMGGGSVAEAMVANCEYAMLGASGPACPKCGKPTTEIVRGGQGRPSVFRCGPCGTRIPNDVESLDLDCPACRLVGIFKSMKRVDQPAEPDTNTQEWHDHVCDEYHAEIPADEDEQAMALDIERHTPEEHRES